MFRKTIAVVLFLALLLTSTQLHFVAQANRPISVTVNGRALVADVAPVIRNGRTLVPFRAIFEALGAQVEWDGSKRDGAFCFTDEGARGVPSA